MGQSTNAVVAFGFDLGEEGELPEVFALDDDNGGFDLDEWLAKKNGIEYEEGKYREYAAKLKVHQDACPFGLESHCSGDYPMYFLHVPGTVQTAHRGEPQTLELPAVPPEKIAAMKTFCDENGIEWREPKWHLFSMWN